MFRFILVIMVLAILISGCAPIKMTVGVSEPNLTEIKPFDLRSDAQKILDKPLWHVGVADGLTYDIYQYESEQPPRPISGVGAIVMDFVSLGTFELSRPRDLTPAKHVAVAYDRQDRVVFVSKPWPVEADGPCRRQRYLIPPDSGVPVTASPEPVIGFGGSTPSSAMLESGERSLFGWYPISADGHEFKEKVIELPAGNHEIRYFGFVTTVELLPGRVYRLKVKNFFGYKKSKWFFFIEDVNSGEVLQCIPPVLH